MIIVSFNEFSLWIWNIHFFYTTEMVITNSKSKQEINIDILKILRELNVELMFVNLNLENEMTELNNGEYRKIIEFSINNIIIYLLD